MTSIYDVLKASKGIHVDDTFAELWGRKLSNAYTVATYTGALPATLQTIEGYLESYKIYGNAVQNGTPTPENPIMPTGCGERTENLYNKADSSMNFDGYVDTTYRKVTPSSAGSLSIIVPVEPNTTYTIVKPSTSRFRVGLFTSYPYVDEIATTMYGDRDISDIDHGTSLTFTTSTDTSYIIAFIRNYNDTEATNEQMKNSTMVLKGSTPPESYIPYGYKLPILSNGVEYPIYLGEVETTRRIKKLVLTGEENWTKRTYGNSKHTFEYSLIFRIIKGLCSHYADYTAAYIDRVDGAYLSNTTSIIITDLRFTAVTDFRDYLAAQHAAGTPVTVWYVLKEPKTGIVNEPLMKIGVYADTIDSTQTSVQIPTAAGKTTISWAGEGLAPSEVKLTYRKPKGQ